MEILITRYLFYNIRILQEKSVKLNILLNTPQTASFKTGQSFFGYKMKNSRISKRLLSNLIDFVFAITLISLLIGTLLFVKTLLYPETSDGGELTLRTELMPSEHREDLRVGDTVFDTLTKRRVGEITDLQVIEAQDNKIYFLLTLDAEFSPRGKSLRTVELWFYFAVENL